MCQFHPTPAIIQCPEEVRSPTPPTKDQNGDKAPSTKPHIYSMPEREDFLKFFLSQRMSVMPVAGQHAFATSCFESSNFSCQFSPVLFEKNRNQ